jgi:hypothetical protein
METALNASASERALLDAAAQRQKTAAGSGSASKLSSSDTVRSDDGSRSGGDGSRKGSCSSRSHEVRSRDGGTPPPGPMRHPLKAPR